MVCIPTCLSPSLSLLLCLASLSPSPNGSLTVSFISILSTHVLQFISIDLSFMSHGCHIQFMSQHEKQRLPSYFLTIIEYNTKSILCKKQTLSFEQDESTTQWKLMYSSANVISVSPGSKGVITPPAPSLIQGHSHSPCLSCPIRYPRSFSQPLPILSHQGSTVILTALAYSVSIGIKGHSLSPCLFCPIRDLLWFSQPLLILSHQGSTVILTALAYSVPSGIYGHSHSPCLFCPIRDLRSFSQPLLILSQQGSKVILSALVCSVPSGIHGHSHSPCLFCPIRDLRSFSQPLLILSQQGSKVILSALACSVPSGIHGHFHSPCLSCPIRDPRSFSQPYLSCPIYYSISLSQPLPLLSLTQSSSQPLWFSHFPTIPFPVLLPDPSLPSLTVSYWVCTLTSLGYAWCSCTELVH